MSSTKLTISAQREVDTPATIAGLDGNPYGLAQPSDAYRAPPLPISPDSRAASWSCPWAGSEYVSVPVADVTQGEGAAKQGISRHASMMRDFVFLPADSWVLTPCRSRRDSGQELLKAVSGRLRLLPPLSVY